MEADEIHCKFPRIRNGSGKLGQGRKMDEGGEDEDGEKRRSGAMVAANAVDLSGGLGRFYGWPSSRIVRVSRASGGKDRHSKVLTSKGLRDRRVRLSVNTAIQFYDLQDRLGYDQPSKAVEWLLKAAAASIAELPPMSSPFPDTPKQLSDEKRSSTAGSDQFALESAEVDMDGGATGAGDPSFSHPQVTKSSACSSTSETSKGSGLSLARSESRIKARERAKGRVAGKEKEKENESSHAGALNPISQTTSFTELLSGGISNGTNNNGNGTTESSFFLKSSPRHWSSTPMDYFASGLLGPTSARSNQMHLTAANPFTSPLFSVTSDHHPELQQFSFVSDISDHHNHNHHHNGGNDYNLNFSISSSSANSPGLAGFNRGTLQSNSSPPPSSSLLPHHHHQLQRFNSDGSPQGFYIGTAASLDNHHQFQPGYDARLQLCYGDRHPAQNGKGKN